MELSKMIKLKRNTFTLSNWQVLMLFKWTKKVGMTRLAFFPPKMAKLTPSCKTFQFCQTAVFSGNCSGPIFPTSSPVQTRPCAEVCTRRCKLYCSVTPGFCLSCEIPHLGRAGVVVITLRWGFCHWGGIEEEFGCNQHSWPVQAVEKVSWIILPCIGGGEWG